MAVQYLSAEADPKTQQRDLIPTEFLRCQSTPPKSLGVQGTEI